jgi:Domain of unknown function (DUF5069)
MDSSRFCCNRRLWRSSSLRFDPLEKLSEKMMKIRGLRSAYETTGSVVYFGRMLDKIRLHAVGALPLEYRSLLGDANPGSFDSYCCRFFRVDYAALAALAVQGVEDETIFQWACETGRRPSDHDVEVWNAFMQKCGWRDESSALLDEQVKKAGITGRRVSTFFDFFDADEGRPPHFPDDPPRLGQPECGKARIPGLRSPRETVGGIVHFGRMLDKIRLFQQGKLPSEWAAAKGSVAGFDGQCCHFLQVSYQALEGQTLEGKGDGEVLSWAFAHGRHPSDEEIEIWNGYLSKRCWRDRYTSRLHTRLEEAGLPIDSALTMFDCIDLEEGRPDLVAIP